MQKVLKRLIELLPVSRRKYIESFEQVAKVIEGLVEAEANHCQIEMSIIQQLQAKKTEKPTNKKSNNDPAFG